jgi:hypothetical protein
MDHAFDVESKAILLATYPEGPWTNIPKVGITLKNIAVYGNRADGSGTSINPSAGDAKNLNTYGIGLRNEGARELVLDNFHAYWCAEQGLLINTGGFQSTSGGSTKALNCVFTCNSASGAYYSGGDSHFVNCQFGFNANEGVRMNGSGTLTGCGAWDNFGNGMSILADDVVITGAYAYDNYFNGKGK